MRFSLVIPAHNEERHLGRCLDSIERARGAYPTEMEVIVVLNRCTDGTEDIARARGCRIVSEDAKNPAKIRNAGVRNAAGEIIVTSENHPVPMARHGASPSRRRRQVWRPVLLRFPEGIGR